MTIELDAPGGLDSPEVDGRLRGQLRQARRDFLVALEPVRASVYRYCRSLTPTVWDAEDLLQETLTKALADASQRHEPVRNTQAWLIRIATNTWLDSLRRSGRMTPADWTESGFDLPDEAAADPLVAVEVEAALSQLLLALPPQERACVVLKDVFSYPLAEIAGRHHYRSREERPAPGAGHPAGGAGRRRPRSHRAGRPGSSPSR